MAAAVHQLFGTPQRGDSARELPHNLKAELAVLGGLLTFNRSVDEVIEFLRPEHFYLRFHGSLYVEICKRIVAGKPVDIVTLKGWGDASPTNDLPQDTSAGEYLGYILTQMIGKHIREYASKIRDCWVRREVIKTTSALLDAAYDHNVDTHARIGQAIERFDWLTIGDSEYQPLSTFDDALAGAVAQAKRAHAIGGPGGTPMPLQFPRLGRAVALLPGEFSVLGGVPGSGKSAIGWQIAIGIAREIRDSGKPISETGGVLGLSFEMSKEMVAQRALSAACGISVYDMTHGRTTPDQMALIEATQTELVGLPLRIIDTRGLTAAKIGIRFEQARRYFKGKIALGIIDHLILIDHGQDAKHGGPYASGRVADAMLDLCKRFNTPLLGLCQLNAAKIAERKDRRPIATDLSSSGKWYTHGDNIILLYRAIQWEPKSPPEQNLEEPTSIWEDRVRTWEARRAALEHKADLIIEKVRNGPAGFSIPMLFEGRTTSFAEDPSAR